MSNESLLSRFAAVMMPTYAPPIALVRGDGTTVWDADGRAYLDLIAGIAVSALGHAHPAVVEAVSRQVATLAHTSNLFANEPGIVLAEKLVALLESDGRVFFTNSGTEANEAAYKLVRRHSGPERTYVVAADARLPRPIDGIPCPDGKTIDPRAVRPFRDRRRFRALR